MIIIIIIIFIIIIIIIIIIHPRIQLPPNPFTAEYLTEYATSCNSNNQERAARANKFSWG